MRASLVLGSALLLFALLPVMTAQQKPRGTPLTISLGGYRLGMARRELSREMACERDDAEFRQRGHWCTPRPGLRLVVVRDTVVAIWVLSTEPTDTAGLLEQWRSDWLPRAERAFGRRRDELECGQLFGNPVVCRLDAADQVGVRDATAESPPTAAWWIGPEDARRAGVIVEGGTIVISPEGQVRVAEQQVAFVLQCWPGERRPTLSPACVAPPYR